MYVDFLLKEHIGTGGVSLLSSKQKWQNIKVTLEEFITQQTVNYNSITIDSINDLIIILNSRNTLSCRKTNPLIRFLKNVCITKVGYVLTKLGGFQTFQAGYIDSC